HWPTRPVKLIVPFPPGGSADLTGRLIAQRLQEALGQPVIVENRAGAGGAIATETVARAAPDGYTLLLAVAGPLITAPLLQKTSYDPLRDFAPISNVDGNPQVLVVNPGVAAKNVRELIALARAQPGRLNISTAGPGSLIDMSAIMFNTMAGVQITLVPYKGGAPAVAAVLAGEAQATFANPSDAIAQVQAGKLRALAVTGAQTFAPMPEVPTIAASGLPEFVVETWYGLVAPAGTPPEIVARLSHIVQDAAKDPAMRRRMADAGLTPIGDTPEQFRAFLQAQVSFWSKFVRESGIKAADR
ncbi:MAG: tripartite tricarboxylate transporter substrate binding protein, partial [Burkholderiales bacterium]